MLWLEPLLFSRLSRKGLASALQEARLANADREGLLSEYDLSHDAVLLTPG